MAYSWVECAYYTQGVKGSIYKKFASYEEAYNTICSCNNITILH
ncbi:viroplasmin family protein [Sedimentibacter sp. zth1]|nr:viroplasmin family protein [Sedimentibacter sp. zth1]